MLGGQVGGTGLKTGGGWDRWVEHVGQTGGGDRWGGHVGWTGGGDR